MNPYVTVSVYDGTLDEEFLSKFEVVVLTDTCLDEQKRINNYCHQHSIHFIYADIRGVFASAFVDFGEEFNVFDIDGEPPASYMIDAISKVCIYITIIIYFKILISFFFFFLKGSKWCCYSYRRIKN